MAVDKPFRDALKMEIAAAKNREDPRGLRKIAFALLNKAARGDINATAAKNREDPRKVSMKASKAASAIGWACQSSLPARSAPQSDPAAGASVEDGQGR